jgi:hypothetical protein
MARFSRRSLLVWVGCSNMASFLNYGALVKAVGSNAAAASFAAIHRPNIMERRCLLCAKNSGGARLLGPSSSRPFFQPYPPEAVIRASDVMT